MCKTIITQKMVFGGDCLAKMEGKVIFIPFVLPNEEIEIKIIQETKNYSKAIPIHIITPSNQRVEPQCKYYTVCGGCNIQHASYEYQRALKKAIIQENFTRFFYQQGLTFTNPIIEVYGNPWEYRNRFQFTNGGLIGVNRTEIIPITDCLCATPLIRNALQYNEFTGKNFNTRLSVFATDNEIYFEPNRRVRIKIMDKTLFFDVNDFFQSNIAVLEKTIPLVAEGLMGENLLDMYSGVGTFSIFLQEQFKNITLVELNAHALNFAHNNFIKKITKYPVSGRKFVKKYGNQRNGHYDAVIVDPPRKGIEKEVIQWLIKTKPHHIRSVSCDPVTHARDIAQLVKAGYTIERLYFMDFYPQTHHIETLAWLRY